MKAILETFKDIPGYQGSYQVSDYGCVRSLDYQGKKRIKYLRNVKRLDGYECINLYRDGKPKQLFVHRLVWEAFNGQIPDGYEIDHVNTVRDDNRLVNLRCVTPKENHANPITAERIRETNRRLAKDPKWLEANSESNQRLAKDPKWREAVREACKRRSQDAKWLEAHRERNRKARNKPILQLDKTTGEVIREWECSADVERELGIKQSNISSCCHGKLKSAGGFKWKFA